jgi:sulfite dehydrogenase (cytochrome) subunit B
MKTYLILLLLAAVFAFSAQTTGAAEGSGRVHSITLPEVAVKLKPGPGRDKVESYCTICHSTDYIIMQPPFSEKKWGEIVNKMIKVFGAPIPADVAKEITKYLGTEYSSGK